MKSKSLVYLMPAAREEGDELLARKAEKLFLELGLLERIGKNSFVGIKIHFGEKGNTGHIKPKWIKGIIRQISSRTSRAYLTDTNTLYIGNRTNSVEHLRLAGDHGFSLKSAGIPVIIADGLIGKEDEEVPLNLGRVKTAKIASAFLHTDALVCLTHVTGHVQTGLGGAIKNLGMGCASRAGKLEQHSDIHPRINPKICTDCGVCLEYCPAGAIIQKGESAFILNEKCIGCGECLVVCKAGAVRMKWDDDSIRIQEKMAEYALAVRRIFDGKAAFLNFLLQVTKDCDCMAEDQKAVVPDIGILASEDPVAIDKASVDMILEKGKKDVLKAGYDIDWSLQIVHGARVGLGSPDYELIKIP